MDCKLLKVGMEKYEFDGNIRSGINGLQNAEGWDGKKL